MNDLSRRNVFKALAAGAAAAALPTDAEASSGLPPSDAAAQAARAAAARIGPPIPLQGRNAEAQVLLCRSWDRQVYLYVNDRVKGFVAVSEQGMAIAAAGQASGRPVAVRYWGHAAEWAGVGRFDGALIALDLRDLPGDSATL